MTRLLFLLFVLAASTAEARWRPEYASQPQEVQDWYANAELTEAAKQRFHFKKCCEKSETVRTKFRVDPAGQDAWQYQKPDGSWATIPGDIIHFGKSGPHGEAVLFQLPSGTLTCFFPPSGSI